MSQRLRGYQLIYKGDRHTNYIIIYKIHKLQDYIDYKLHIPLKLQTAYTTNYI